jgi:glycosyltransferase involved in cell wall biosynthesis
MPAVLLVTQDLQRAGAQRQCVELALGLARRPGWRVEVATLTPGGPLAEELRAGGVPLVAAHRRWRWDLSPIGRIADRLRGGQFDVLHSFLFLPNFYGRLARLLHRPPLVISSLRSTGIHGVPRYVAEILMAPLCDLIIANSEAGRSDLLAKGVSTRRLAVVRNGLDLARFAALAPRSKAAADGLRIGMVAQMEARKDQAGLVEAFALIAGEYPEARLILAGDGSLRPRVEATIRRVGLENRVDLPGTIHRPELLYGSLDLYVQSSASQEGTSNSIIEAMASGLPVIATDIGGNREVVEAGVSGLIVPAGQPDGLASSMASLLGDAARSHRMGAAARERALRLYSRNTMIEATVDLYESALAGTGSNRAPHGGR